MTNKTIIETNDARTDMVGEYARRFDTGRHDPFEGMRDFYGPTLSGWWIVAAGVAVLVGAAIAAELLKGAGAF